MKKWYLSTPMNGKTEKEIQAALQRGIDWVKARGDEYHSPYNPNHEAFDENGIISDSLPINALAHAIMPMDGCTGLLSICSDADYNNSKGCQIEWEIAEKYGMDVEYINFFEEAK
ncbi:hypothetical protein ACL43R_08320 [Lactococcus formosensis]|uniref:hypothetical protein n=1 Tax=Lactococcus formosensis TaxID=1281486 RepID=UPI0039F74325